LYKDNTLLPIRVEDVDQKSKCNGGPERLLRVGYFLWIERLIEKHGDISSYMPVGYEKPVFGCIACPPQALSFLYKNLDSDRRKYFYYMNDASEIQRLKSNLVSVVDSMVRYCIDKNIIKEIG